MICYGTKTVLSKFYEKFWEEMEKCIWLKSTDTWWIDSRNIVGQRKSCLRCLTGCSKVVAAKEFPVFGAFQRGQKQIFQSKVRELNV